MQVDLIAIGNAEGYSFYYDHLPVLGMSVISNIRAVDNLSKSNYRLDVPPLLPLNQNKWKNEIEEVIIKSFGISTLLKCFIFVFHDALRGCVTIAGQKIIKQLFLPLLRIELISVTSQK